MASYFSEMVEIQKCSEGEHQNMSMNTADWRWAAYKGYWDPVRRCWNEAMGGLIGYISQRNKRQLARISRQKRALSKWPVKAPENKSDLMTLMNHVW